VVWIKARVEVVHVDVERETAFWTGVVGGPLPPPLTVQMPDPPYDWSGGPGVKVEVVRDIPEPPVPPPASFPGVLRTRVYQICVDRPHDWYYEHGAEDWARMTGGTLEPFDRRPEFTWVRIPGGPHPLELLLQRVGTNDPLRAHLDVGTSDRTAEVRRHLDLGATHVADEEFWTVLADPVGFPYCVTDRDPATGELTG
jgi:hypothetical protein